MGISKSNLGVSIESVLNFITGRIPSSHNVIAGRDADDAHPISAVTGLQDKMNIMDDISVAQKTVNTRGTKELLTSRITIDINAATTEGNPAITNVLQTITLNGKITDYDFINIQIAIDTTQRKYISKINTFSVPRIVYNTTTTFNNVDGSALFISNDIHSQSTGSFGVVHFILRGWFKSNNQLYLDVASNPIVSTAFNKITVMSIQGVKVENTTIDPVEYVNTDKGIEDSPVGHILSQMGKVAPKHYLICDGSIYNITDYPHLSQYIKDQFGTFNFFGGDGINTFAVPDLRNEFLRGYHGDKTEKLSGEIGIHQKSTEIPTGFYSATNGRLYAPNSSNAQYVSSNYDNMYRFTGDTKTYVYNSIDQESNLYNSYIGLVSARPTNVAVLYCIKYEPTYFMSVQGLMEETSLWEGIKVLQCGTSVITINSIMTLTDNLFNYDEIEFCYSIYNSTNSVNWLNKQSSFRTKNLNIDATGYEQILLNAGSTGYDFMAIIDVTSTNTLNFRQTKANNFTATSADSIRVTKIIGIKYKTFQN